MFQVNGLHGAQFRVRVEETTQLNPLWSTSGNNGVTRNTGPSDLNVGNGQAGHATVTHDCPPGAIQVDAYLSTKLGKMLPLKGGPARQQR